MLVDGIVNLGDLVLPEMPERSRLFSLEPINLGQPNVECLASYFQRLMNAHLVDLDYLLDKEIQPLLRGKNVRYMPISSFARTALNTNWLTVGGSWQKTPEVSKSLSHFTKSFIQVLERLTLRSNLDRLTVLPLKAISPRAGMLRGKLAWCPDCLNEWRDGGSIIYYPLLWQFNRVLICPSHERFLRLHCPNCERFQGLLPTKVSLGYCSECGEWLSSPFEDPLHYQTKELRLRSKLGRHRWVANSIGDLIAFASISQRSARRTDINRVVVQNIKKLNISRYQILEKRQQEKRFKLDGLLRICYLTEMDLASLVFS